MISQLRIKKGLQAALFGLALAGSASLGYSQGANDYIVSQFDDGSTGGWSYNYGGAHATFENDPAQDRGPGASPGALKVTIPFDLCILGGDNQCDWEHVLADTLDLTKYTKLHFSVKVDPSSAHLSDWGGGQLGPIRPHVRLGTWAGDVAMMDTAADSQWVGTDAYGAWKDYAMDINQTQNLDTKLATRILGLQMWSGWGSCAAPIGLTNTVIFWMDNIWFELNTNTAPVPPPTMGSLQKAGPAGVRITLDTNGDQYQRDAVSTPSGGGPYFWTSQNAYPVTYSMTIADFPDLINHTNFEAHMYIINKDTAPSGNETYGGADWNVPDLFILRVENNYDATNTPTHDVLVQIQMKTNLPNANPPNDAIHRPAIVHAPSAVGTWTVTFADATHGTLSGPGITPTNFVLSADIVANNFSPAASFMQFGMFKNDVPNDGHNNQAHGTFSHVKFDGAAAAFEDDFSGATLTNKYAWRTTSASAVQHIPAGTAWIIDWTVPDTGFNLNSATAITGPWNQVNVTGTYQSAGKNHALVPQSAVPAGTSDFFAVIKRPFVKLQVLLPGETAAPNTPSGKTGSPDSQSAGIAFTVRINAVDASWNRVPSTDTIAITSTDSSATLPADGVLSLGSRTVSVTLNASGSFTVTATDVTDGTKTAGTSATIVIP